MPGVAHCEIYFALEAPQDIGEDVHYSKQGLFQIFRKLNCKSQMRKEFFSDQKQSIQLIWRILFQFKEKAYFKVMTENKSREIIHQTKMINQ
jgi:hypothetical protein